MFILASHLIIGALALSLGADAPEMLSSNSDALLASRADSIEVVYTDGRYSHLEYGVTGQQEPISCRPPNKNHRIKTPRLTKFGLCISNKEQLQRKSAQPCGFVADISAGRAPLDLLSFDMLHIKGKMKGTWTVALADEGLAATEENYPIGVLSENGPMSFSLSQAASHLDLKRMRHLVFILESQSGELQLEHLEFTRTACQSAPLPRPAIWMWDNRPAQSDAESVVRRLAILQIRRVYLQVGDELEPLSTFLRECRTAGIEVFALDGAPSYLNHPVPLLDRVQAVKEFNLRHPDTPFAGFQIDIEPHLNKDFRLRLDAYGSSYVELLDRIQSITKGSLTLSTVIPFWYDTLLINGRTLAWQLIKRSDEVVIMSYRTTAAEVETIARDELFYGERLAKPVLLGIETGRIPDELHVTFRRCTKDIPKAVMAGGSAWCRGNEYIVPGSRISFMGNESALNEMLARTLSYRSFSGWVIHSYETAPR